MAVANEKLAQWRSRLSELVCNTVHRAGVNSQAADALLPPKTNSEDKTTLEDKGRVINVPYAGFACAAQTVLTDFHFIKEPKDPFIPFMLGFCMKTGVMDNEKGGNTDTSLIHFSKTYCADYYSELLVRRKNKHSF